MGHAHHRHLLEYPHDLKMQRDLTGYPLTCCNEEALKSFNDGVFAIVTLRENGFPMLKKALELDDSIIIAHCIYVST